MADVTLRSLIEDTLAAVDERLRTSVPGPAARELRVRYSALSRVVRGWVHVPPHDAQVSAMLECVLELEGQVLRTCVPKDHVLAIRPAHDPTSCEASAIARRSSRPPPSSRSPQSIRASATRARTTRPPPRRDASMKTTRPPPPKRRHSEGPPSSR